MRNRPSRAYLRSLQARYLKARKKQKSVMLDEFTQTTGANRDYASRLLQGRYEYVKRPIRHPRAHYHTPEDAAAREHLWELLDGLCSKLLVVAIPQVLLQLRVDGTLNISDTCAEHLLEMSPSTIDRLLARRRPKGKRRRGLTKPGTFLSGGFSPNLRRTHTRTTRFRGSGLGGSQRWQRKWRICSYFRHGRCVQPMD